MMSLPKIALTMGDPAGVGPEICLRALDEPAIQAICLPIVFGDMHVLQRCAVHTGLPLAARVLSKSEWPAAALADLDSPAVLDLHN